MIRKFALLALPLAAACSAPAQADDTKAVDAAIANLYAPYGAQAPDWDAVRAQQNYSAATAALIGEWEKGLPPDEVTDLADFDWLCECQDWDSSKFKLTVLPHAAPKDGKAEVTAKVDIGWDEAREQRFVMVKEADGWKVDDMVSQSFPQGLKVALREAIANPRTE